ncbi:hypothetical protein [Methanobrevibacter sp. TMH8]|uniref:hypothetical protein n=1 Tax=Methanobrevibacter sp. TMH8 TaxID=2848611 RepID=UPI001CCA0395|nr:hypothetical protein [Methanobrevibacter sp. TMH8]
MPRALKIILIILLFIGFFEAGLLSSYTIITSEAPDVKGLIDLQISTIADFFSSENINSVLIKDPQKINITNEDDVATNLSALAKVDGIDINTMNVTTYSDTENGEIDVNITALGFSSPNTTSGQIVLSGTPDYLITATAKANVTSSGIIIDLSTIRILSILKLFGGTNNSTINGSTVNAGSSNSNSNGTITIG